MNERQTLRLLERIAETVGPVREDPLKSIRTLLLLERACALPSTITPTEMRELAETVRAHNAAS